MRDFPIITKLGGRDAVFEYLRDKGLVQTKRAIGMWSADGRGTIPGDSARELLLWAEARNIPHEASDLVLGEIAESTPSEPAKDAAA